MRNIKFLNESEKRIDILNYLIERFPEIKFGNPLYDIYIKTKIPSTIQLITLIEKLEVEKNIDIDTLFNFVDKIINDRNINNENFGYRERNRRAMINPIALISSTIWKIKDKLSNTMKYYDILKYEDITNENCLDVVLRFRDIDNLDDIFFQAKIIARFQYIRNEILEDIIITLIGMNSGVNFNLPMHYNNYINIELNKDGSIEPYKRIAKLLLYGRHEEFYIDNFAIHILSLSLNEDYFNHRRFVRRIIRNNNNDNSIDIHSGDRDEKTKELFEIFIGRWNPNKSDIEKYFNDFWEYTKTLLTNDRIILLRVLGVDENLNKITYNKGDFGGLLSSYSLQGINPKEFLARFWYFASTYEDNTNDIEVERLNIKKSIMSGLINALQNDTKNSNHVVCDPGKIQRIVISTLQGRIKDKLGNVIYIDDLIYNEKSNDHHIVININNYNNVELCLKPFIDTLNGILTYNSNEFFKELFIYINNLYNGNVPGFDKSILDPVYVIYYCIMMARTQDGIEIKPELSLMSNYEDMFNINDYKRIYLNDDITEYENTHPEIIISRNKREKAKRKIIIKQQNIDYEKSLKNDIINMSMNISPNTRRKEIANSWINK
jgi:hypothetical protein